MTDIGTYTATLKAKLTKYVGVAPAQVTFSVTLVNDVGCKLNSSFLQLVEAFGISKQKNCDYESAFVASVSRIFQSSHICQLSVKLRAHSLQKLLQGVRCS